MGGGGEAHLPCQVAANCENLEGTTSKGRKENYHDGSLTS
jgi:hypothetical protein